MLLVFPKNVSIFLFVSSSFKSVSRSCSCMVCVNSWACAMYCNCCSCISCILRIVWFICSDTLLSKRAMTICNVSVRASVFKESSREVIFKRLSFKDWKLSPKCSFDCLITWISSLESAVFVFFSMFPSNSNNCLSVNSSWCSSSFFIP